MSGKAIDDLSPLAAELREQDPDRYLATLFAPPETRDALFALYAFDHEIAKVRRLVREPMAGLVRLQWWKDALDGIERDDVVPHPVVKALHRARRGLDRRLLLRAIDGRERELEDPLPPDMNGLERHFSMTGGSVAQAAAAVLGGTGPQIQTAAEKVGLAHGALDLLRRQGRDQTVSPHWLPNALLAEDEAYDRMASDMGSQETVKAAQGRLVRWARQQLVSARSDRTFLKRRFLPALFPGTLADIRLHDVISGRDRPAIAGAPIRLLWCQLRGVF